MTTAHTFTASASKWINLTADTACCANHADHTLADAIASDPKATTHNTPTGTWNRVGIAELQKVANRFGFLCATCHEIATANA